MTTLSIAEVINKACEITNKKDKVEFLKVNDSRPLRNILKLTYDKSIEIMLPDVPPPYVPSPSSESHGALFREARKLKYFVNGYGGETLTAPRRESLFIQMLEAVDPEDAKVLCNMIAQRAYKGLPAAVINEAFGDVVPVPTKSK